MTEEQKRCAADDIICEMALLNKMKNLQSAFEDENFRKEFPSLVELEPKLSESIREKEINIRERLEACNLPSPIISLEEVESKEEIIWQTKTS